MQKRKLKPAIRTVLEGITMILGIMLISISDFTLAAIPLILLMTLAIIINVEILEKF